MNFPLYWSLVNKGSKNFVVWGLVRRWAQLQAAAGVGIMGKLSLRHWHSPGGRPQYSTSWLSNSDKHQDRSFLHSILHSVHCSALDSAVFILYNYADPLFVWEMTNRPQLLPFLTGSSYHSSYLFLVKMFISSLYDYLPRNLSAELMGLWGNRWFDKGSLKKKTSTTSALAPKGVPL